MVKGVGAVEFVRKSGETFTVIFSSVYFESTSSSKKNLTGDDSSFPDDSTVMNEMRMSGFPLSFGSKKQKCKRKRKRRSLRASAVPDFLQRWLNFDLYCCFNSFWYKSGIYFIERFFNYLESRNDVACLLSDLENSEKGLYQPSFIYNQDALLFLMNYFYCIPVDLGQLHDRPTLLSLEYVTIPKFQKLVASIYYLLRNYFDCNDPSKPRENVFQLVDTTGSVYNPESSSCFDDAEVDLEELLLRIYLSGFHSFKEIEDSRSAFSFFSELNVENYKCSCEQDSISENIEFGEISEVDKVSPSRQVPYHVRFEEAEDGEIVTVPLMSSLISENDHSLCTNLEDESHVSFQNNFPEYMLENESLGNESTTEGAKRFVFVEADDGDLVKMPATKVEERTNEQKKDSSKHYTPDSLQKSSEPIRLVNFANFSLSYDDEENFVLFSAQGDTVSSSQTKNPQEVLNNYFGTDFSRDYIRLIMDGDREAIEKQLMMENQVKIMPETEEVEKNEYSIEELQNCSDLKYFDQRYKLFSRFDEGIKMNRESWFSVTPEVIAQHIATKLKGPIVVDPFCGVGGNLIQFALAGRKVIGIDISKEAVEFARNNACVYNVEDKIELIVSDSFKIIDSLQFDCFFYSPPWGGPNYISKRKMNVRDVFEGRTIEIFQKAIKKTDSLCFFLPRNISFKSIITYALYMNKPLEIEKQFVSGRLKTVTAYFGPLVEVT